MNKSFTLFNLLHSEYCITQWTQRNLLNCLDNHKHWPICSVLPRVFDLRGWQMIASPAPHFFRRTRELGGCQYSLIYLIGSLCLSSPILSFVVIFFVLTLFNAVMTIICSKYDPVEDAKRQTIWCAIMILNHLLRNDKVFIKLWEKSTHFIGPLQRRGIAQENDSHWLVQFQNVLS